ncbi:hypothetical protein Hamer_G007704 [Homarus americanus]|uniref:Uncharacterized protein n=1 Tax=Homarus americanus TaxID=6706 RepID=A0A8J5MRI0_HOMAM|nr:hypothetical protein Hamer_G007704 [Homarus americanus]
MPFTIDANERKRLKDKYKKRQKEREEEEKRKKKEVEERKRKQEEEWRNLVEEWRKEEEERRKKEEEEGSSKSELSQGAVYEWADGRLTITFLNPPQESATNSSHSGLDSEEEDLPAPTPPLFNGHAITNGLAHHAKEDVHQKDEAFSDRESFSDHDAFSKEDFHSLVEVYNREGSPKKEVRSQTPLSDEEDLAGVSVKQLRVSYLSAAQENDHQSANKHKITHKSDIKADLNTSVNISSLVDTYSTPQPRAPTPSNRPDDLAPVSLQSLKSVYEATATASSSAGSRYGSSCGSSPASSSPAPKEELNISLHQLREEYCRSVQDGHTQSHTPTRTPPETGVSIRQLTRSMTDLRGLGHDNSAIVEDDRSALAAVNVKALTRSFSDLTRLSEPIVSSPSRALPRHDIPTFSVSVKKLRASYGDLPSLLSSTESGKPAGVSPRSQSHSHTMCTSKIPRLEQPSPTLPSGGCLASHGIHRTFSLSCLSNKNLKSTLVPTKASEVHSAHSRAHAALSSNKSNSNTYSGIVDGHITSKKLNKKPGRKHKSLSRDKNKIATVSSKKAATHPKTADISYSTQESREYLGRGIQQRPWLSAQDLTKTHTSTKVNESVSSSTLSLGTQVTCDRVPEPRELKRRSYVDQARLCEPPGVAATTKGGGGGGRDRYITKANVARLCATFVGPVPRPPEAPIQRNINTGVSVAHMKAAYQYRDDLLEKHVGPRVRSFDAAKMKSKFEKPQVTAHQPASHGGDATTS